MMLVLAAGCLDPYGSSPAPAPAPTAAVCGFTSCHGLDLACGSPPPACPADYRAGDRCRQLASCRQEGGTCSLVLTQQFEACRQCVERCGGADSTEILLCEEKC